MEKLKQIKNIIFGKLLVLSIIVVLLCFIISSLLYWFMTMDEAEWDEKESGKPSNYTQNVQVITSGTTAGLNVDKDAIIKAGLTDKKYSEQEIANMTDEEIIQKFQINKKLKKNPRVTSLDEVTQAELLWCTNDVYSKYLKTPEQLEKLLNAEIITQYPDMGQTDGKLNGIIKFERHKNNGSSAFLTYVDSNTFSSYVTANDTKALDYFTLDNQGNALIAYYNTTTETLTTNDDIKISDYTETLNDSNKQSDGNYSKTITTVSTIPINYKSVVEKYTMPFNYLWSLLVIGKDVNFVLELADLVENSQITISVYDNITTTEDVNTYTYKKETRTDKYARLFVADTYGLTGFATQRYWLSKDSPNADGNYNSKYEATYSKDDTDYTVTHTIVTKRNDIKYDLTKADVWIVDYSKEYAFPDSITPTVESNSANLDDTEYVLNNDTSKNSNDDSSLLNDSDAVAFAKSIKDYIDRNANGSSTSKHSTNSSSSRATNSSRNTSSGSSKKNTSSSSSGSSTSTGNSSTSSGSTTGSSDTTVNNSTNEVVDADVRVSYVEIKNYDHKIERKQTQTVTTTEQKYVAQTPINNPKDDKNADKDNFVKILCQNKHAAAKNYLTDGTDKTNWLFDVLEKNAPDMLDLTKYLFNKVLGKNVFSTDFDFSEYDKNDFASIGSSTSSNILFDYLASWESTSVWKYLRGETNYSSALAKYITEDKSEYICYTDSNTSTRNFGFGVCHTGDNGKTYWHVAEYQEEGINISSGNYNTIGVSKISVSAVDGVKVKLLSGYQESIKAQLNNAGILTEFTQPQIDALTCIMYQYGNIGNFVQAYKTYGNTDELVRNAKSNSGKTYFNSNVESNGRSQANWKLFHEGVYTAGSGEELSADNYSGGAILDIAAKAWQTVCAGGNNNSYGAISNIPFQGGRIDCSGFVSWVLYEAGYTGDFYYQHNTSNFLQTNWNSKYGWEEIEISSSENPYDKLKPGDILVRNEGTVHHMNIVAKLENGEMYAYDCGSEKNWINNSNASPINATYFLKTKARGKIIRITK